MPPVRRADSTLGTRSQLVTWDDRPHARDPIQLELDGNLNLIPSFGACTRSCFVPRYLSVFAPKRAPAANGSAPILRRPLGTFSRMSDEGHGVQSPEHRPLSHTPWSS